MAGKAKHCKLRIRYAYYILTAWTGKIKARLFTPPSVLRRCTCELIFSLQCKKHEIYSCPLLIVTGMYMSHLIRTFMHEELEWHSRLLLLYTPLLANVQQDCQAEHLSCTGPKAAIWSPGHLSDACLKMHCICHPAHLPIEKRANLSYPDSSEAEPVVNS